jgi:hypothetical protein
MTGGELRIRCRRSSRATSNAEKVVKNFIQPEILSGGGGGGGMGRDDGASRRVRESFIIHRLNTSHESGVFYGRYIDMSSMLSCQRRAPPTDKSSRRRGRPAESRGPPVVGLSLALQKMQPRASAPTSSEHTQQTPKCKMLYRILTNTVRIRIV